MRRRLIQLFKLLLLLTLVGGFALYLAAEFFFNVSSNAVVVATRGSPESLQIHLADGSWRPLREGDRLDLSTAMRERFRDVGFHWRSLQVRRPGGRMARLTQKLFGAEVHVIEIDPSEYAFFTSFQPEFERTTARERLEAENLRFTVVSNFQYPSGKPMGWVWHEGRLAHNETLEWSGVFVVKEGKPWFGPKSLLDEVPGLITEGSQVYPSVMKNHTIFDYVNTAPDRFFNGQEITYRSLAGVRKDGTVVFVLSGDGGAMRVGEVALLADFLNVQHATLLDGGKALQFSLRTEDGPWHFQAYNTRLPFSHPRLEPQKSPVYIGVRRRPPLIHSGALPPRS